jgi:L-alanine-DL-glutamate epimerase-like enolase superfamily enzyme
MATIDGLGVSAYTIPTDAPESDGTMEWDSTTVVVVEARAGGHTGLGYTYGDFSVAGFVESMLEGVVSGRDALAPVAAWSAMRDACRNAGRAGPGAMAISAVDCALWDLAARLQQLPLATLLGRVRDEVPVYGSGGFCSYDDARLTEQLSGWVADGLPRVKIKVGREPERDEHRLDVARAAIGADTELFVDANGAFRPKEALAWAHRYAERGVTWLEEPVSSDDEAGLALIRDQGPAGLVIAAGEYAWDLFGARALIGVVDCLQADVTRCGGFTALRAIDGLCQTHCRPLSLHCAPALSAQAGAAAPAFVHLEYFHDHVRIERMLFDGTLDPAGGDLRPDPARPGNGLALKRADAEHFRA